MGGKSTHGDKSGARSRLAIALLVLCLLVSGGNTAYLTWRDGSGSGQGAFDTGEKYTLYIGTNDKDSYTQLMSTKAARKTVDGICAKHVDGYTSFVGQGGWVDETGALTQETTLVYMLYGVSKEQLTQIVDETLVALNQSSILVEKADTRYRYEFHGDG